MAYKLEAAFKRLGEFGARYGGGPMEEITPDKEEERIEKIFDSYEEAEKFAKKYMKKHIVAGAAGGSEWVNNTDFSWIEANEKHLKFAKRTRSYDYYWLNIYEVPTSSKMTTIPEEEYMQLVANNKKCDILDKRIDEIQKTIDNLSSLYMKLFQKTRI